MVISGSKGGLISAPFGQEDRYACLGSSFDQDSETCMSSDITSPRSISQLELPMPERLLPIGPQRDFAGFVEHVRQALGVQEIEGMDLYHPITGKITLFSRTNAFIQRFRLK